MNTVRPAESSDGMDLIRITEKIESFTAEEKLCLVEIWEHYNEYGPLSPYHFCISQDAVSNRLNGFSCYGKHALTANTYDLYWIAVDPDHQRSGIGSDLLRFVEQQIVALHGNQLLIETSSTPAYQAARSFYRRHHYQRAAVLRNFYAPGDHLIIYTKDLKQPSPFSTRQLSAEQRANHPDLQTQWGQKRYY